MGELAFISGLVFYLSWCVINGLVAAEKNRGSGTAFALSIVLSPLLIYLYIAAVPPLPKPAPTQG